MERLRRTLLLLASMLLTATLLMTTAAAAAFPEKPIKLIVGGGAGSVGDVRARWLAARLVPALGQPVIVENQPSANGILSAKFVANSAPDGYTLLLVHMGNVAVNPHLYADMGYPDPFTDFAPITRISTGYGVLTVHPDVPAHSVAELIKLAKDNPGKLNYGTTGIGGPPWMSAELFKRMANIEVTHVPYKGGGDLLKDLIAGRIDYWIEGSLIQMPYVKAGRLRPLAVTGPKRLDILPDVPTLSEAGLPGYEFQGWTGLAAPGRTPRAVIDKLNAEIVKVLRTPEAMEWFAGQGNVPAPDTPEQFAAFIRAEHQKWGQLVRDVDIKAQ